MSSKVLVTGSCGYVGTATKELLQDYGYQIVEVDKKINKDTRLIFKHVKPKTLSFIIHLSAKKSIQDSLKNPAAYYINNLFSTFLVSTNIDLGNRGATLDNIPLLHIRSFLAAS